MFLWKTKVNIGRALERNVWMFIKMYYKKLRNKDLDFSGHYDHFCVGLKTDIAICRAVAYYLKIYYSAEQKPR